MTRRPTKQQLKEVYQDLVRAGFLRSARMVLGMMITGSITIGDGNNEAYESGLAYWLQGFRYSNSNFSFTVYMAKVS